MNRKVTPRPPAASPAGRIEKILDLPAYTEGPVRDAEGNCFFTTLGGGVIYKLSAGGELAPWARSACPNGQVILDNGDHLVCDSQLAAVIRFNRQGKHLKNEITGSCGGAPIAVPNDIIADKQGNIYFTDSIRHQGKIGFIGRDGRQMLLDANLDYPNGLALSADGQFLFVAESYKNRILKYSLRSPGERVGAGEVFADLPRHPSGQATGNLPDGLKVDEWGRLWVAHYGMGALQLLSPEGKLLDTIATGLPLTSNLCLAGKHILITGGYGEPGPGALLRFSPCLEEEKSDLVSKEK